MEVIKKEVFSKHKRGKQDFFLLAHVKSGKDVIGLNIPISEHLANDIKEKNGLVCDEMKNLDAFLIDEAKMFLETKDTEWQKL